MVSEKKHREVDVLNKKDDKVNLDEVMAFLGKGTEFKGVVTYNGTIRVDGKIEGEIITKGTLIVGETAEINAQIQAGSVVSAGKINGDITAIDKVQLQAPAILIGSIKSPVIIIEEGVIFNGACEMKNFDSKSSVYEGNKADKKKETPLAEASV